MEVRVGVKVMVAVGGTGVFVRVKVGVKVRVAVAVGVRVAVAVGVRVGVEVAPQLSTVLLMTTEGSQLSVPGGLA